MIPVASGFNPVSNDVREGLHNACWQYALSNTRPCEATASMLGDFTLEKP